MGKMMQCKGILRECALAFVILIGCREIRAEMQLGTNLMELFWYNGYRDYFVEGVNWATVTNPWKPELIRDLKAGYTVIRFMEWDGVCSDNGDPPIRSKWSERTPKTANHYTVKIAAYEWMIDLCNRTGLDLWLCIPHKTFDDFRANPTDNYWTSLAKLVKEQLNPSLNVYVEYSNETWNSAGYYSAQYNNCIQMAGQLGLSGGDCDFAQ